jgi:hypothetical protein
MGQDQVRTAEGGAGAGRPADGREPEKRSSVVGAMVWMLVLSLLLFWLPFLGPLIAGVVGGKKAGTIGRAVLAALLPTIITGVLFFLLATVLTGMPILGAIAGMGAGVLVAAGIGPLILGAIIGGILA